MNIKNMKKETIQLNEKQLRGIIRHSLNGIMKESKGKDKLTNSFKSKEDMTKYRDMYAPNADETIYDTDGSLYDKERTENGEWGSGPFADYHHTSFADGYDYCGDDEYNDAASEYNRGLEKRLATKGGQMSYDWEHRYDNMPDDNGYHGERDRLGRYSVPSKDEVFDRKKKYDLDMDMFNDHIGEKTRGRYVYGIDDEDDLSNREEFRQKVNNDRKLEENIKKSLRKVLKEHGHDIDDDSYYGGGLPDEKDGNVTKSSYEIEIMEIYNQIKPLTDKLEKIINNCDHCDSYDEIMNALEVLDRLPEIAKSCTSTEVY